MNNILQNNSRPQLKRNHKDGMFRMLFNDEEKILELYNALSGENLPPGTKVEIVTLESAIFGDQKNDLAFIIGNKLIYLIDHQSTYCPNMPLRMLSYIAREYEKLLFSNQIYSRHLVRIPTPEFYVFYNGIEDRPLTEILKLSDAFSEKCGTMSLELAVSVINVNCEKGAEILKRCTTLAQYSEFISTFRRLYAETGDKQAAAETCIKQCMERGILDGFLKRNGGDVLSFLFDALTREECEAIRENDGYLRGLEDGEAKGEKKSRRAIATSMLQENTDHDFILKVTGISREELVSLLSSDSD